MPTWFLQEFAGIEHWRWVALVLVIALGFIVDLIVRFLLRKVIRSFSLGDESSPELAKIIKRVPRPAGAAAGGGASRSLALTRGSCD